MKKDVCRNVLDFLKISSEWCYKGESGHPNLSSERFYQCKHAGVLKPQHIGVIATPVFYRYIHYVSENALAGLLGYELSYDYLVR